MKNLPVVANVTGLGKIVEVADDFYRELKQLKACGARLISPRDDAYARLQTRGKENIGQRTGTRTRAGFEYARGQFPLLRLESRLANPRLTKLAVDANLEGYHFCTESTNEYEKSLKQAEKDVDKPPIERNVLVLPSRDNFVISNRENWEIYQAIFKDQAEPYFELNGPITIYLLEKNEVDVRDGTLLTDLLFWSLNYGSCILGDSVLDGSDLARGILGNGKVARKNHKKRS